MNILESFRVALRGLASNKMRTALTMLGIIIGVAVVIIVVAIGQGATKQVTDTVNSLGTNLLTVMLGPNRLVSNAVSRTQAQTDKTTRATTANRLILADAQLIASNFKQTVEAVVPVVRSGVQIRLGSVDSTTNINGVSVDYPYVNNAEIQTGAFFTQNQVDGSQKVCVIGTTVAEKLTGDSHTDLTGQQISINRIQFTVLGILAPKGSGAWGQDQDDIIVMPITTAMRRVLNKGSLDSISIRCVDVKMMPLASEQISNFLRNRHHLQPPYPDNDDFVVRSQTDLLARSQSVTSTMTTLLSIVAVISLVVGGIGIMNIMLVSVTERTREIGIRKAIGATPRDILLQFVIESAIISLIGGVIGIVLGVGGSALLSMVAGWNTIVSTSAIFAAVGVSGAIGIFFGIYPASKAAALHPIEALRYE